MDKGEYENELKQVLGDTRAAYDISEHDTLVFGEHGILVAGPNSRHHEPLLVAFMQVRKGGAPRVWVPSGCRVPSPHPRPRDPDSLAPWTSSSATSSPACFSFRTT